MGRSSCLIAALALLLSNTNVTSVVAQSQNANRTTQARPVAASTETRASAIPTPYETSLPNGLQVVIVEDHRQPIVNYRLAFRTGDASDPADAPGLTAVMLNLLRRGTQARTGTQIANLLTNAGAAIDTGSNSDYTLLAASAPSKAADQILALLADIAQHPAFPTGELELIKQNGRQGLVQQRAQSSFLASERLAQALFDPHPYSKVSTTPEALDVITRERVLAFHQAMFIPNNAVLIVVGDVRREALMKSITEVFGKWAGGVSAKQDFPAPTERTSRTLYLVDRPGSAQSNVIIANTGIARTSDDYFPMLLLHTILGAPASGRLHMNLHEARGYTQGASSILDARRSVGLFGSMAEIRTAVTGPALKEFFHELERMRTELVPDQELRNAKSYLTGLFPSRFETQDGLIDQLVQLKMFGLPPNYLQTYNNHVNAVTARDIQRVAQQYIVPDKAAIVIVGDAAAIMEQIRPYAQAVEIYDASGQRRGTSASAVAAATSTPTSTAATPAQATTEPAGTSAGATAALPGIWSLQIQSPNGQTIPATLTITQEGSDLKGKVQTQMGDGSLSDVRLNGNNFDARLTFGAPGQSLDGKVSGITESSDRMKGTIILEVQNMPPLPFTGTRSKQ